jgi:hypothetical protein
VTETKWVGQWPSNMPTTSRKSRHPHQPRMENILSKIFCGVSHYYLKHHMVREMRFQVVVSSMIIPELHVSTDPKVDNRPFSTKGSSGGPPKQTLCKGFVKNPPPQSNSGQPSHYDYGKLSWTPLLGCMSLFHPSSSQSREEQTGLQLPYPFQQFLTFCNRVP